MLKVRLTRVGKKRRPYYRIVVLDSKTSRDGPYVANIGWYDPMQHEPSKKISIQKDQYKEWLKKGAQPSEALVKLLKHSKVGI